MSYRMSRRQRARMAAERQNGTLTDLTRAELEEVAGEAGVEVARGSTKPDIAGAIQDAATAPAPGTTTAEGGE